VAVNLQEVDPLEAIEMELDEEEDAAVYEHLYDDKPFLLTKMVNGPSYRRWKLPLPVRLCHRSCCLAAGGCHPAQ
jgi:pre-mRNA-processing factor 8